MNRYIKTNIINDLQRKMVFVGGARQVGKTTMAKDILKTGIPNVETAGQRYFNWDDDEDKAILLGKKLPFSPGLVVLDEIHKYKRWRQLVKGVFDKRADELKILVTGSARLDYYRKGGDSLQGRYHYYRLHPLSLKEIGSQSVSDLKDLLLFSGFPEPFLARSEREARRWSLEYRTRVIRDDLRDLEKVNEISLIERMTQRMPELVGSPLSLNALREDLQVSHQTVRRWIEILERLYVIFRIYPFGGPLIRAVKKEAKHYHFDWTQVKDMGLRFENLVACHLLKWCHFIEDTEGFKMELRYFRDTDKREVDFVVMKDGMPIKFVECKSSEQKVNPHLRYLHLKYPEVPAVQVHLDGDADLKTDEGIRICPATVFLNELV